MNFEIKTSWICIVGLVIGLGNPPQSPAAGIDSLANAANDFAFRLLHRLSSEHQGGNLFFSPLSVHTALAVAYGGAQGETKAEMAHTLSVNEIPDAALDDGYRGVLGRIAMPDTAYTLDLANALWMRKGVPFKPDFVRRATKSYLSETLPLTTPEAINTWAAKKTHDRITQIVGKIDPLTILFITNAVYFKGFWVVKFDSSKTKPKDFHTAGGSTKLAPMMSLVASDKFIKAGFRYMEGDGLQGLEMPYKGNRLSMYIFLPEDNLDSLIDKLQADRWHILRDQFKPIQEELHGGRSLRLEMPRFKLETEYGLVKDLTALGMKRAFLPYEAEFGALVDGSPEQNIYIKDVAQKAFVQVNEEGTEAAAVTKVQVVNTSMPPKPLEFIVNRPFFFLIVDRENGLILFMGAVYDPASG